MAKEYDNVRLREHQDEDVFRLQPRVLYQVVCELLQDALDYRNCIPSEEGFVDSQFIGDWVVEKQEEIVGEKEAKKYTTDYQIPDIIKGINKFLKKIDKTVERKKINKRNHYKGYPGLVDDYKKCYSMFKETPVDKGVFDFIKGTLNFNTLSAIRNRINDVADKAWADYKKEHPKRAGNKTIEKEIKAKHKPDAPFICIEGSVYEFTPDYEFRTEEEREKFLDFADAIIYQKAVKVSYQAFHYQEPDDLEFHPHYIRKVGNKLMVYGYSRSIEHHAPGQYTLVNLIVQRVKDVMDFKEDIHYYSAKELGLDYNRDLFYNRMTFNMPGFQGVDDACMEVLLKVRKVIETPGKPKMPFERIKSEPLHHSQKERDEMEDDEFGYVSLFIKDYMYIKPILLKWGGDIQVLKPVELRAIMENEVRRMAAIYGITTLESPEKETQSVSNSQ